jgi:predicted acetyltransferase
MRGIGIGKVAFSLLVKKATQKGIKRILITAHKDNIASRKMIEYNNGVPSKSLNCNNSLIHYYINIIQSG